MIRWATTAGLPESSFDFLNTTGNSDKAVKSRVSSDQQVLVFRKAQDR